MDIDEQDATRAAEQGGGPDRVGSRPVGGDETAGLIRRVRRLAKLSQRELAHELGVSQSAVAKWETGRTCPTVRMLVRILGVAGLGLAAVRDGGERVRPMKVVAARDAGGRRYPAHTFVWAEGWWAPEGSETNAWFTQILLRSEDLELPGVRYSRWWPFSRPPTLADVEDHPTWHELVAEAKEGWSAPRRRILPIPEWAFQDTKKSRNRRPGDYRFGPREVSSTSHSTETRQGPTRRRH